MENKPFISIVMPVYNAAKYLNNIFEDVLNQTYDNWELIAVNDCSQDQSGKICDEFAERDKRIRVLHLEENGGAGNARNQGIELANGEYITFVDADDNIELNLYEKVFEAWKYFEADVIAWGLVEEYYNKQDDFLFRNKLTFPETICKEKSEIKNVVLYLEEKTLLGYQWNKVYRRELLTRNGIRFENAILYEDYFFNVEVMKCAESMYVLNEALYRYKKRDNDSITTRFVPEYFELSKRRISSMFQLYQQWDAVNSDVINILGERYLRYILAGLTKSYDKRANENDRSRKVWLRDVKEDLLYSELVQKCAASQKLLQVFRITINMEMWNSSLFIGKMVWLAKEKLPLLFNKIRRFK